MSAAAMSAAATSTAATSAAATSTAATSAAATASASGKLYVCTELGCGVFLVEDKERAQADVRDFLFAEDNFVAQRDVLRRQIRCGGSGRRRCAADHRQRHAGDSRRWYGFPQTFSLRSVLRMRHSQSSYLCAFLPRKSRFRAITATHVPLFVGFVYAQPRLLGRWIARPQIGFVGDGLHPRTAIAIHGISTAAPSKRPARKSASAAFASVSG
jgi:hypothetical protein